MKLKSTGADVFINLTTGRFATQAIRKACDIDWYPIQFIPNASLSIAAFLDPVGFEKASDRDANNVYGYEVAQTTVEVLRKCGDDLIRSNVMKQAASLDLELGMLRPGIRITTSPTDYRPIKELYLITFDGKDWVPLGQ